MIFHHKHSVRVITDFQPQIVNNGNDLYVRAEVCPSPRRRPALPKPSQRSLKTEIRPEKGGLTRFTPLRRPTKPEAEQETP